MHIRRLQRSSEDDPFLQSAEFEESIQTKLFHRAGMHQLMEDEEDENEPSFTEGDLKFLCLMGIRIGGSKEKEDDDPVGVPRDGYRRESSESYFSKNLIGI